MKTALVTGGNRGIGKAIAQGLVTQGIRTFIGVRDPGAGPQAALDTGAEWVYLNLEDPGSLAQAFGTTGDLDILVNNAGVLIEDSILDEPTGFYRSMQVMVNGPFELIRLNADYWRDTGWGRIVNVSSNWGAFDEGLEGPGGYGVAKAALNALTRALFHQLPEGVKVNSMCPGWVQSRMGGEGAEKTTEEGADTAIWLATLPDDGPSGGFFRDRKPKAW